MPPGKRKSVPPDSSSDDDYVAPAKVARKSAATASSGIHAISGYIAKLATSEYDVVQTRICQSFPSARFPDFSEQCTSCIQRQTIHGTCRFVNLRAFKRVNGNVDYGDYAFRSNLDLPELVKGGAKVPKKKAPKKKVHMMSTRVTRSRPASSIVTIDGDGEEALATTGGVELATSTADLSLTPAELKAEADYVLPLIAPTFAEQLRREQRHESGHLAPPTEHELPGSPRPLIRILSLPETRSLCDGCSTSIYMGSYLCGCCGLELCLGCWEEWEPSEVREGSFFHIRDACSKKRRHTRDSMVFITRASDGEVSKLLERVKPYISSAEKQEKEGGDAINDIDSIPTSQPYWPNDEGPKYLPTPKTHHSELTLRQFQALWRRGGTPLVLTGFTDRFKLPWDPQYFIRNHGSEPCFVHDCIDGTAMVTTVTKFFSKFDDPTCISSHKLKDWPPSADFSTAFPKLFQDFESALPFPSYTARKGTLNLAAHFPEKYNAPDLGPKMYNAYPAPDFLPQPGGENSQSHDVKGTTNLHLDLTDAMNIMLFSAGGTLAPASSTTAKGIPACGAIWDIFPPSASLGIRTYLNSTAYRESHPGAVIQDDPIHRQCYYLTETDLTTLSSEYGVQSHRIFQQPGEAVFVPAGCCHQVRNRKSCVKVAVDFLTPENVVVCKGLIEEARRMADKFRRMGRGKEDVLQLWACLAFAWEFYDIAGKGVKGVVGEAVGSEQEVLDGFRNSSDDANMTEPELKDSSAVEVKLDDGVPVKVAEDGLCDGIVEDIILTRTEIVVAESVSEAEAIISPRKE